jgi:hypothetical protein
MPLRFLKKNRSDRAMIFFAGFLICAAALSTCFILLASSSGVARGKMEKKQTEAKALAKARELMPDASEAEEVPSDGITSVCEIKDKEKKKIGAICLDRVTGKVTSLYNWKARSSSNVKLSLAEAQAIAEGFFASQGIDMSFMAPDPDESRLHNDGVVWQGGKEVKEYLYVFSFRPYLNGLPVENAGYCDIRLSPEDGSIISYCISIEPILCPEPVVGPKISKEEAIKIVRERAQESLENARKTDSKIKEILSPKVDEEGIEMRYFKIGDEGGPIPCWIIKYEREVMLEISTPEGGEITIPSGYGGEVVEVSAEDGRIIGVESF